MNLGILYSSLSKPFSFTLDRNKCEENLYIFQRFYRHKILKILHLMALV
jgi:hypothetical protein